MLKAEGPGNNESLCSRGRLKGRSAVALGVHEHLPRDLLRDRRVEDVHQLTLVRILAPHVPVPLAVQRRHEVEKCGEEREAEERQQMLLDQPRVRGPPGSSSREQDGQTEADEVVDREPAEDPVALGVPPDVPLGELAAVPRVQDEPVVVPQGTDDEVHRQRQQLVHARPFHAHREVRVEQEEGHEEREHVVAGQGLLAHDRPVGLGVPGGDPVPGGGVLRPALAAL